MPINTSKNYLISSNLATPSHMAYSQRRKLTKKTTLISKQQESSDRLHQGIAIKGKVTLASSEVFYPSCVKDRNHLELMNRLFKLKKSSQYLDLSAAKAQITLSSTSSTPSSKGILKSKSKESNIFNDLDTKEQRKICKMLSKAIIRGDFPWVYAIIDKGFPVDHPMEAGLNLLNVAVYYGQLPLVITLIKLYGLNPISPSEGGARFSALEVSVYKAQRSVFAFLANIPGVDLTQRFESGYTLSEVAAMSQSSRMQKLLQETIEQSQQT